jgi:hypothetical protein
MTKYIPEKVWAIDRARSEKRPFSKRAVFDITRYLCSTVYEEKDDGTALLRYKHVYTALWGRTYLPPQSSALEHFATPQTGPFEIDSAAPTRSHHFLLLPPSDREKRWFVMLHLLWQPLPRTNDDTSKFSWSSHLRFQLE